MPGELGGRLVDIGGRVGLDGCLHC